MADKILIELDLDTSRVDSKIDETIGEYNKEIQTTTKNFEKGIESSSGALKNLGKSLTTVATTLAVTPPAGKGLLGSINRLGFASGSLLALSQALRDSDNSFAQAASSAARFASIITGGLAAALTLVVLKLSDIAFNVGSSFVNTLQNIRDKSNEYIASQNILNTVITNFNRVTGNAVGFTDEWTATISKLSTSLNISTKELNKSAQEIVAVGSQLGLTSDQMQKLIKVSAEYAKINKKDVFQTTVNLVNALNGNATAVAAYGIKLNQASVQQFALSQGITKSISTLSESEKVQLRYNKLLKQYKDIAGIATVAASQLDDQENALNVSIERLNASFGSGVAVIENYNLASKALNIIATSLNETFVASLGFISALGARFLQVGGFLVSVTFKIFLAVKALKVLQTILDVNTTSMDLLTRKIGIFNVSVADIVSNVTRGRVGLSQLSASADKLRSIMIALINPFVVFKKSGSLSIFASLLNVFKSLAGVGARLLVTLAPLGLVFAKFAAIAAIIVGPFILLFKAFKALEERTGALSTVYGVAIDLFKNSTSVLSPVINLFTRIKDSVIDLADRGFGILVFAASKAIGFIAEIVQKNPFGVFSQEAVSSIGALNGRLEKLGEGLQKVGFRFSELPQQVERSVAGLGGATINLEELAKSIDRVRDSLRDVGLTDIQKIERDQAEKLEVLRLGFENQLLQEQEFNELTALVRAEALDRLNKIEEEKNKERLRKLAQLQARVNGIVNQGFTNAIAGGIQNVIKSLADGENAFANFGKFLLNTFGDLAIQLGTFYIAQGIANAKLLALDPTATIAAGVGLVALGSILKSFFGGGGGEGASQPSFGSPSSDFTNSDFNQEFGTQPETIAERGPNNQIIVQGSIVDPQGILDAVSQVSEENGAVLTGVSFA